MDFGQVDIVLFFFVKSTYILIIKESENFGCHDF